MSLVLSTTETRGAVHTPSPFVLTFVACLVKTRTPGRTRALGARSPPLSDPLARLALGSRPSACHAQEDPRHAQQPHPQGKLAPRPERGLLDCQCAPLLTLPRLCVAQSPQNWQTSVGLPFFQIEGTVNLETARIHMLLQKTRQTCLLISTLIFAGRRVGRGSLRRPPDAAYAPPLDPAPAATNARSWRLRLTRASCACRCAVRGVRR